MTSEFGRILRRLKPEKRRRLDLRPHSELSFVELSSGAPGSLLYDTTVYIDVLQGRFPHTGEALLRASDAWHSTVAASELASACGLLHPAHPGSRNALSEITAVIERMPSHRTIAPDFEIWCAAGILAGVLARIQGTARGDRRRVLNDALIFASGRKHGHAVLTRNVADFDFLQQLDPAGQVLFYRV